MILEKCDMVLTVCPKEMCTNIVGTNRKPVHGALILALCKCKDNLNILFIRFPFQLGTYTCKWGKLGLYLGDNFYIF